MKPCLHTQRPVRVPEDNSASQISTINPGWLESLVLDSHYTVAEAAAISGVETTEIVRVLVSRFTGTC